MVPVVLQTAMLGLAAGEACADGLCVAAPDAEEVVSLLASAQRAQGPLPTSSLCSWEGTFIVTRLWEVVNPTSYSSQDVVDEFEKNFAPLVTALPGFLAYLGATTKDPSRAFFANVFQQQSQAALAQSEAKAFVDEGVLDDKITPFLFTEGQIKFQHVAPGLCSGFALPHLEGMAFSVQAWELKQERCMSADDVLAVFEAGFAPMLSSSPGFRMYVGAAVQDQEGRSLVFLLGIFKTQEQAKMANLEATMFVKGLRSYAETPLGGFLMGRVKLDDEQTGVLDFSFLGKGHR